MFVTRSLFIEACEAVRDTRPTHRSESLYNWECKMTICHKCLLKRICICTWCFPGGASGKQPTCQCRRLKRHRLDLWVGKISWRRVWQPWTEELGGLHSAAAAAAKSLQLCPTLCNPIDSSLPGSPSLGFSRQEHWSGLPFPSPMHESEKSK